MNDGVVKAQAFVNQLQKSGISFSKALLFGSWAKGKATNDSDIDICVISDKFGKDYTQEMVDLRKVALTIDSRIEPIPFTSEDLNDPHSSIAMEIRKNSIGLSL